MAFRLGDQVVCGELFNTRNYSVHGRIQLRDTDRPMAVELTGNCCEDLRGKHFRFETRPNAFTPEQPEFDYSGLAWHQIGATGSMTADHWVKMPDCPMDELLDRFKQGERPSLERKRCLYLEWFSQNGRVVLELPDALITLIDEDDRETVLSNDSALPPEIEDLEDVVEPALGITAVSIDDNGKAGIAHIELRKDRCVEPREKDDSPDSLEDLQKHLDEESRATDRAIQADDTSDPIHELELMDDLMEHGEGTPIEAIFSEPERLPGPDNLSDSEAETILKSLLSLLALHGIALHVCEHFTPRDVYRLLKDVIAKEESFHPELGGTQWVQNFMTGEYCRQCEEEIEREMEMESSGE